MRACRCGIRYRIDIILNDCFPSIDPSRISRAWVWLLLLICCVWLSIAPTLTWPQFTGGNENIVVQTALEMRRDAGPVIVPNMLGEPRVRKPPLVAWITASSMDSKTINALAHEATREQAYIQLAWQVRWTGLLAGCVIIAAAFVMGRTVGGPDHRFNCGPAVGLAAALVVCSNLLFLKYARQSTSDIHLAMWVTIANASFAAALLRHRPWLGATAGAFAVAMAFLCKGPVALVQTVLPMMVFYFCFCRAGKNKMSAAKRVGIILVGTTIFAVVALPWFVYVYHTVPSVWEIWFSEVTRENATQLGPDSPAAYLVFIPLLFPWIVFGVTGCIAIIQNKTNRGPWLMILQVIVPLCVMVWAGDRKERYLLPFIAPAAVICAIGVVTWLQHWRRPLRTDKIVLWIHIVLLIGGGVGLGIVGVTQQTFDGRPWWGPIFAAWVSVACAAFVALGLVLHRRIVWAIPVTTVMVMLGLGVIFMHGYRQSRNGMSELKPLADIIRRIGPDAEVYDWTPERGRVEEELAIYLNRSIHAADPQTLLPGDVPRVIILCQAKNTADPTLPPPWRVLGKVPERKNWWWAFELPGRIKYSSN
jgi:4-amino-4-deoxy-L-arabinose transferase-like glycosyltransferase